LKLVLDSGALIALEKNDRAMWTRLKAAELAGEVPLSHGGVVGQAWRGRGPRHALLARALGGIEVRGLDEALGRVAGELLATARTDDVIDAALVLLADEGDRIMTSDSEDLEWLAQCGGRDVEIVRV
jgi:hypothetical protein